MLELLVIVFIVCATIVVVAAMICGAVIQVERNRSSKPSVVEQLFGRSGDDL